MKIISKYSSVISTWLIPAFIILFYIFEAYQKFLGEEPILTYIKAMVFIALLLPSITLKNKNYCISIMILGVFYIIGQWFTPNPFSYKSILILFKFLFPLIVLESVNNDNNNKARLFNTAEWMLLINSLFILVGFLFEFSLFKTYTGSRFGYNGLFYASATSSYIYAIGLIYFVLTYKKDAISSWKYIVIVVSSFLIGTKTLYLIAFFTIAVVLFLNRKRINKYIAGALTATIFLALVIYLYNFSIIQPIRKESGIISAILSYRNELLINKTIPYVVEYWSWINYIVGGVSNFDLRAQMEIVDVFFFWGIVGGAFYYYLFFKLLSIKKLNTTAIFLLVQLSITFSMAGNFFTYSFVALFLAVLKLSLLNTKKHAFS